MVKPDPASTPRGHAPLRTDILSLARTISDRRLCRGGALDTLVAHGAQISHSGVSPSTGAADYESRVVANVYDGFYLREGETSHRRRGALASYLPGSWPESHGEGAVVGS